MSIDATAVQKKNPRRTLWRIFRAPLGIGLLSIVGLIAALVGDGPFDALSWLGLGIPVALTLWYGWWRPRRER